MESRYWLLNHRFTPNGVYRHLADTAYAYVVGMDIGSRDTKVSLCCLDPNGSRKEKWAVRPVKLDHDAKIPTVLSFREDGSCVIGADALEDPDRIQAFRVSPALWNKVFPGHPIQKLRYEELMEAYIREVWKLVLNREPILKQALAEDKVLLTVGCPASPLWTDWEAMLAYRTLLTRATGCSHTAVLPEPTAAIMSMVLDSSEEGAEAISLELSRGLAVIDAGAASINFTYVLPGQQLISCSLPVAGDAFDEAMLDQLLEDNSCTREELSPLQQQKLLTQLRQLKEDFYPNEISLGCRPLNVCALDETGREVVTRTLSLEADKTFMEKAANRKAANGHLEEARSWKEQCSKFIRDCSIQIRRDAGGALLCDRVILTGGTSNIPALYDAAAQVFSPQRIWAGRNRSVSVSMGLAYAKGLESDACQQIQSYQKSTPDLVCKHYRGLLKDLAEYISEAVCDNLRQVTSQCLSSNQPFTAGQLIDRLNIRMYADPRLVGKDCRQKLETLFATHFANAQHALEDMINDLSRNLYGSGLEQAPSVPEVTEDALQEILKKLDISRNLDEIFSTLLADSLHISVLSAALGLLSSVIALSPYSYLSSVLGSLSGLIAAGGKKAVRTLLIRNKTKIPRTLLVSIHQSVSQPDTRSKLIKNTAKEAVKILEKKKIMKDLFHRCVCDQAEVLLGKVLFLVYDQQPMVQ